MNLIAIMVLWVSGSAQDAERDAVELLARVRAGLGDQARLESVRNLRIKGRADWEGAGEEAAGVIEEVYSGLRARCDARFGDVGVVESGFDGKTVWESRHNGVGARTGWEGNTMVRRFALMHHVSWETLYESARLDGQETVEGRRCHKLTMTPRAILPPTEGHEKPEPDTWFIDVETERVVRVLTRWIGEGGDLAEVRIDLGGWKDVGGIAYPHNRSILISGFPLFYTLESFEHDVELEEGFFDIEESVVAALEKQAEEAATETELKVSDLELVHVASVRVRCKEEDIQKQMAVMLPEVFNHVASLGVTMKGPPLVRTHSREKGMVDIEAAVPIDKPIEAHGRIKPSTLPAGQAVVTWHIGPFDALETTHKRIEAFLSEESLTRRAAYWEEYWTDPGLEPDPAKWRTKVVWPVE